MLATSKQIHDEAKPILCGKDTYIIDASYGDDFSVGPLLPVLPTGKSYM